MRKFIVRQQVIKILGFILIFSAQNPSFNTYLTPFGYKIFTPDQGVGMVLFPVTRWCWPRSVLCSAPSSAATPGTRPSPSCCQTSLSRSSAPSWQTSTRAPHQTPPSTWSSLSSWASLDLQLHPREFNKALVSLHKNLYLAITPLSQARL